MAWAAEPRGSRTRINVPLQHSSALFQRMKGRLQLDSVQIWNNHMMSSCGRMKRRADNEPDWPGHGEPNSQHRDGRARAL